MDGTEHLFIVGASARAAAYSAMRAGLRPWCADLFADADLSAYCPVVRVDARHYPRGLIGVAHQAPVGPWMYTGALENHASVIHAIARRRPLWGNDGEALESARSPLAVARLLEKAKLPHPLVHLEPPDVPGRGSWLVKPLAGSGGRGIRSWDGQAAVKTAEPIYYQAYVEGEPCAAVYLGDGQGATLLGVTRQLSGEAWLHAEAFQYCGSLGPLCLGPGLQRRFEQLGDVLAVGCGLRGLFGVDAILREGVPWPVEVNPRYTASVEVLEYATGVAALGQHRAVFDVGSRGREPWEAAPGSPCVGKAILFARDAVTFPRDGPWSASLRRPGSVHEIPRFADIPPSGQRIQAGQPILTCFASGESPSDCMGTLRQIALDLDRRLWGR